jgi:hypothetical protein
MAETRPIHDLDAIVNDGTAGLRNRLNAAIYASRVEKLAMPGETEPPAVVFVRSVVALEHAGTMFRYDYRRESAAALAYWERRCKKAELQYKVPDENERRASWRRILNGVLCAHLGKHPRRNDVLFKVSDTFEMPPCSPEVALSAILLGANSPQRRRRQKSNRRTGSGGVVRHGRGAW